jgi:spermidine/putrescine transport system permease protein
MKNRIVLSNTKSSSGTGEGIFANWFALLSMSLTLLWPTLFVLIPYCILTVISFLTWDELDFFVVVPTLQNYLGLFHSDYSSVLYSSLWISSLTTLITLLIAYPISFMITHKFSKKLQQLFVFLIIIPYWTSSLLRVYGIKMILGAEGPLNSLLLSLKIIQSQIEILYTPFSVILGFIYLLLPLMILPLYSSMEKLDKRLLEASYDLSASKLQTFLYVIWPLTLPGVVAGCLMVFLPSMGMFYIADILGGAKVLLLGNLIKGQFLEARNWPMGAALNTILFVVLIIFLLLYWRISKKIEGEK